jgi:hypothetical protein
METAIECVNAAITPFLYRDLTKLVIQYYGDYKAGDRIYLLKGKYWTKGVGYTNVPCFYWIADFYPEEEMLSVVPMNFVLVEDKQWEPRFRFGVDANIDFVTFCDLNLAPRKFKKEEPIPVH